MRGAGQQARHDSSPLGRGQAWVHGPEARPEVEAPVNLVAADVSPLHLKFEKVRADSRRLLRFKGSMREISLGEFSA